MPLLTELRRRDPHHVDRHTTSDTRDFLRIHRMTVRAFDVRVFGRIVRIDLAMEFDGLLEFFIFLGLFTNTLLALTLQSTRVGLLSELVVVPANKTSIYP